MNLLDANSKTHAQNNSDVNHYSRRSALSRLALFPVAAAALAYLKAPAQTAPSTNTPSTPPSPSLVANPVVATNTPSSPQGAPSPTNRIVNDLLKGAKEGLQVSELAKSWAIPAILGACVGYVGKGIIHFFLDRREVQKIGNNEEFGYATVYALTMNTNGSLELKRHMGGCLKEFWEFNEQAQQIIEKAAEKTTHGNPILEIPNSVRGTIMQRTRERLRTLFSSHYVHSQMTGAPYIERRFVVALTSDRASPTSHGENKRVGLDTSILLVEQGIIEAMNAGFAFSPSHLIRHEGTALPKEYGKALQNTLRCVAELYSKEREQVIRLHRAATEETTSHANSPRLTLIGLPFSVEEDKFKKFISPFIKDLDSSNELRAIRAKHMLQAQNPRLLKQYLTKSEYARVQKVIEEPPSVEPPLRPRLN